VPVVKQDITEMSVEELLILKKKYIYNMSAPKIYIYIYNMPVVKQDITEMSVEELLIFIRSSTTDISVAELLSCRAI
jgi:hypothetical protein